MNSLRSNGSFVGERRIILPKKKREKHTTKIIVVGMLIILIGSALGFGLLINETHKSFKGFWSEERETTNTPWPMFRHDLNHTGLSPYDTSSNDGTQKWSFTTGNTVESSPAIGPDGTIYVGSYDHYLYAINPDGTEKWKFQTGDVVFSSPAIGSDGTIYVGSDDGNLYAIGPTVPEFSSPQVLALLLIIVPLIAAVGRKRRLST